MTDLTRMASELREQGYCFAHSVAPHLTTSALATSLGTALDLRAALPATSIPSVQSLRPRRRDEAPRGQYSSVFGLGAFPLHTDLAHWGVPPRYLLLRCVVGASTVGTQLLPVDVIVFAIGVRTLGRAVFRPRRAIRPRPLTPLPLLFSRGTSKGLRWDPIFLVPMNVAAQEVSSFMAARPWSPSQQQEVNLVEPGDVLLLDNWRMLHGRSAIPPIESRRRHIERAYLTEVHA